MVLGVFILILSVGCLAETYPSLRFERPIIDGEIFNKRVTCGLQSQSGFIWFCTDNGLARYDGYTLKYFRHDPNNINSISSNKLSSILEDKAGNIWIGTDSKGINKFNLESESFSRYLTNVDSISKVLDLFQDSAGFIWISTWTNGLIKFDPDSKDIKQYLSNDKSSDSISTNQIWKTIEDPHNKGNLWIATSDGLDYFDKEKNLFIHYDHNPKDTTSISKRIVLQIYYDSNDVLWVGTYSGLNKYIPETNSFQRYYPDIKNATKSSDENKISTIYETNTGIFLVGTEGGGLKIFDEEKNSFYQYKKDETNQFSINDNDIVRDGIFEDTQGILWIETQVGINKLNLASVDFKNYRYEFNNNDSLSGNIIWELYEDPLNRLWAGTDANGLNRYDNTTNRFKKFRHNPNDNSSLSSNRVYSVLFDSDETLWVGTNKGLNRQNKGRNTFRRYDFDPDNLLGVTNNRVYWLLEDSLGYIWIATTNGLRKYDKNKKEFTVYRPDAKDPNSIVHHWIRTLFEDSEGRIWIGTGNGLSLYQRKSDNFVNFKYHQNNERALSHGNIQSISQTRDGFLWLGTNGGGISRLNANTRQFKHYTSSDGLISNMVFGVLVDNDDDLWISTPEGLSQFDHMNNTFNNYFPEDGLQNEGYNNVSAWSKLSNGELAFGGVSGFDLFLPKNIKKQIIPPNIVIADFLLFNNSVQVLPNHDLAIGNKEFKLTKSINHTKQLTLTHKESLFSFEFAALDYLRPNKNQYAYKMEGLDDDWIHTPASKRFATYMNVPPGEYTFRVKGSNKNGVWNEEGKSIKVIILPPPWLTWWAKTLYAIAAISLLIGFYTYRTRALRRRAVSLEKVVKDRTQELAVEKNKVEKLLEQKTEEFANVSHEFRTPLTLILGPLAQLLKDKPTEKQISRLNVIQRNGYRLLRMVDQLLNLETFRVNPIIQRIPINTGKTIRMLTEAFKDLAVEKGIQLELKQLAEANFEFTADAFEKIVLNLLSNAVKYTKSGGVISIETTREKDLLTLQIIDTGIGIPENKLESIFERFSRVLDKNSEQVIGSGIGLALVKNLVEAHEGKIEINSELDTGTTVKIILPIINEVDEEVVSSSSSLSSNNQEIIEMEIVSLTEQTKQTTIEEKPATVNQENHRPTILVIEDNQDMRDYIVGSIGDDYQTLTATNGEEGIELAKKEVPDLIISDIMMPQKDGFETTKALRDNDITNHIPIILLTALGDNENRIKGWQEKADEYLTKPFNVVELKTRIVNLLSIRNILKRRFSEGLFDDRKISANKKGNEAESQENYHVQQQEKFVDLINSKLEIIYTDSNVSIPDIANSLAMSERQISRKIKNTLDMTPSEYLRRFRLEKAKQLLREGSGATNTAFDVGFSSASYFAKCFKAQYGVSPKEFVGEK